MNRRERDGGSVYTVIVTCILSLCVSFFALGVAAGILSR